MFIIKILLCKNEEEENDYEDVDGPIYYENEEQLKEFNLLMTSIKQNNHMTSIEI